MYIEGLENAIANDNAKKTNGATTPKNVVNTDTNNPSETVSPTDTNKPSETVSPTVTKKISIDCEDESTKPKTLFKIFGADKNGAVVAEGYKDQMLVRLIFDNRKPELGRTIEVVVNGESNKLSLKPGLGPIGFKPGFAMRMLLKAIGVSSDLKINCFPLSQTVIPEPKLEVTPANFIDDSGRENTKASGAMEPAKKNVQDAGATVQK